MFEVKFTSKRISTNISKALCAYYSEETKTPGPNLERFETASGWQGQGFGALLLEAIERYYRKKFTESAGILTKLYIDNVLNLEAREWYVRRGYQKLDESSGKLYKNLF